MAFGPVPLHYKLALSKALPSYFVEEGCCSLLYTTKVKGRLQTFRVPNAFTQLLLLKSDVFSVLQEMGLAYYLGIGPWGVHSDLVCRFMAGIHTDDSTKVIMTVFEDHPPVTFDFTKEDVCAVLHFPSDNAQTFTPNPGPKVVPEIISADLEPYCTKEGYRFSEIPLEHQQICRAIAQVSDPTNNDNTQRVPSKVIHFAKHHTVIDWASLFYNRVKLWADKPTSFVNFAHFATRYLCAKFRVAPPEPAYDIATLRVSTVFEPGVNPKDFSEMPEKEYIEGIAKGVFVRPDIRHNFIHQRLKLQPIKGNPTEFYNSQKNEVLTATLTFQEEHIAVLPLQEIKDSFVYYTIAKKELAMRVRTCTPQTPFGLEEGEERKKYFEYQKQFGATLRLEKEAQKKKGMSPQSAITMRGQISSKQPSEQITKARRTKAHSTPRRNKVVAEEIGEDIAELRRRTDTPERQQVECYEREHEQKAKKARSPKSTKTTMQGLMSLERAAKVPRIETHTTPTLFTPSILKRTATKHRRSSSLSPSTVKKLQTSPPQSPTSEPPSATDSSHGGGDPSLLFGQRPIELILPTLLFTSANPPLAFLAQTLSESFTKASEMDAELKRDISELKNQLSSLRKDHKALRRKFQATIAVAAVLNDQKHECEKQVRTLQETHVRLQEERASDTLRIQSLEDARQSLLQELKDTRHTLNSASSQISKLQRELEDATHSTTALRETVSHQVAQE